jgi:hypothetical protein
LRDRVLAGSVGSVDHSSDEETKTATLPSGNIKLLVVDRVTRRLEKEKNQQFFQRIAQKVAKSKKGQNIYNKAQFESPKHLHHTTFETLKYLLQTMFCNCLFK